MGVGVTGELDGAADEESSVGPLRKRCSCRRGDSVQRSWTLHLELLEGFGLMSLGLMTDEGRPCGEGPGEECKT